MAVPDFQSIMLPLLQLSADRKERSLADARTALADGFQLSEADRSQLLPSGRQAAFANRVAWARVYLTRAGLLISPRRGFFHISDLGLKILADPPARIDIKFLSQFPAFEEFRKRGDDSESDEQPVATASQAALSQTPEETLESAYGTLRGSLAAELLDRVKAASPKFFENLVVELLLAMGYGGSRREAARAIGQSGDEGIDGTISEDRLGLDIVYLQAKRWQGKTVGRPDVQAFVGALHGKRAKKGVYLTTSTFSSEAREYVAHIDPKVVLIDGRQLAELMIDFNVGAAVTATYEIKRLDSDYFVEE